MMHFHVWSIIKIVIFCLHFSRRALGLVNLTKGFEDPEVRKIPRQSKWEVSTCQWNPHKSHANFFITAVSVSSVKFYNIFVRINNF